MSFFDRVGIKVYNAAIRKRNEYVRNPEKARETAKKAARYIYSVGSNITQDVTSNPSAMFPFTMSQKQRPPQRRKKRKRQPYNPYPLL
jgi:hypothetical protein